MAKKILWGLLAVLVIIQFFGRGRTNPVSDPANDFIAVENPPESVATAIKNSCYDCHSDNTEYPWYAGVAPVSWMISAHVKEGREHVNFSEWGTYPKGRTVYILKDCYEEIDENKMPLPGYRMMHKEAVMDEQQKTDLLGWMSARGNWED